MRLPFHKALRNILWLVFSTVLLSCGQEKATPEKSLAQKYCSSCHSFPDAGLLDTLTWKRSVLPAMAKEMGIGYYGDQPFKIQPGSGPSLEEWEKIVNYYVKNAPPVLPPQQRAEVTEISPLFEPKFVYVPGVAATAYIGIDARFRHICMANAFDSSFSVFDDQLQLLSSAKVEGTIIDINIVDTTDRLNRKGIFTNIGTLFPNDMRNGSVGFFYIDNNSKMHSLQPFIEGLARPVQTIQSDINGDGLPDYVICEFGNKAGALSWYKHLGNGKLERKMLRPFPGAIKAYVDDFNNDGRLDIIALFGQADEGIHLFLNNGDDTFTSEPLLRFPPVFGSSYFEMVDVNGDGQKDIIYTCGDNADLSPVLKNYHGVYIFLNKGGNKFEQSYFFPVYGCYKAVGRDFDGDGDIDIALIAYFPDPQKKQESFIFLENKGNLTFDPSIIMGADKGNWLTMDAADLDGDGDEDIVLGNFQPPLHKRFTKDTDAAVKNFGFLLLINKSK